MKHLLLLVVLLGIQTSAKADFLDKDGIVKSENGTVRRMTHWDAMKACPQGTHLATIREFARFAQKHGARMLETYVPPRLVPSGYQVISSSNPDGTKDTFYFNPAVYLAPEGDIGREVFWSSSNANYDSQVSFEFFARDASIRPLGQYYELGVRCVNN